MKLTELKEKIDEALKLHSDYDVKIIIQGFMEDYDEDINDAGIAYGRFNFELYTTLPLEFR